MQYFIQCLNVKFIIQALVKLRNTQSYEDTTEKLGKGGKMYSEKN